MAFMIFRKHRESAEVCYADARQGYKLAGTGGLLYKLWVKRNKPVESGWSVTADEILRELSNEFNSEDFALVIDFHPSAQHRIGLVEIEAIHVFTYGDEGGASWSPMMLELREVYYNEDFDEPLTQARKDELLSRCRLAPTRNRIVEFLYLQGGWSWGRNGSTNAAFIHDEARMYFQKFFDSD